MGWRTALLAIVLAYGFGMYFVARSNPIHGARVGCLLQMAGYGVLLVVLGFGRADLSRITWQSLFWGTGGALLSCSATFLMFWIFAAYPTKAGLVSALSESWVLVTVLLIHLTRTPMTGRQWLWVLLATGGIIGLALSSPQK